VHTATTEIITHFKGEPIKHPITFLLLFLLPIAFEARTQTKKYDIKSGIITFETTMKMIGMTFTTKSIVYFDEYGMKECKESYKNSKLEESFFSDGKSLYKAAHDQKRVIKAGTASRGTEFKFDWNEILDKDKEAGKTRQLPNMAVAGKTCQSFEYSDGGTTTKFAGWSGICLLTETKTKDMRSLTRVLKIEENAKVPAEKFALPAGYAVE
jgi:hypothetical protein